MKRVASILLLAALFMVGCQEDSSILEPQSDLSFEQLPKGRPILGRDYDLDLGLDSLGTVKYEEIRQLK